MQMGYFDTSLFDLAQYLTQILLYLNLAAIVAGVATLPVFFIMLFSIVGWFRARDQVRDAIGETDTMTLMQKIMQASSPVFLYGFPIVSILCTLYLFSLPFPETLGVFTSIRESVPKAARPLTVFPAIVFGPLPLLFMMVAMVFGSKIFALILRSLGRNLLRTSLTYLAIFVLVFVVTSIWSVLTFLDTVTREKENDFKAIITERYQIPSQMKPTHLATLKTLIEEMPPEMQPKRGDDDIMTWAFVGGSMESDPAKRTFEKGLFFFCMEPRKLTTMMDGLDELTGEQMQMLEDGVRLMNADPEHGIIIGKERLKTMGKKVGDVITLYSINYKDITFRDLKIVGQFPEGRYDQSSVMHVRCLQRGLDGYKSEKGVDHPLADKCLNLIWLKLPTKASFELLSEKVNSAGVFSPAVKMETSSSGVGSFLDAYKDLIWALRWLLSPAILATMCLVISNAISISVRERRTEMAVLKVLGFQPWQVMMMVLGEAVLVGVSGGYLSTAIAYAGINAAGGLPLPIAFFPKFFFPTASLWWGVVIGAGSALLGAGLPAWSARSIKVSEVFSRVA